MSANSMLFQFSIPHQKDYRQGHQLERHDPESCQLPKFNSVNKLIKYWLGGSYQPNNSSMSKSGILFKGTRNCKCYKHRLAHEKSWQR